MNSIDKCLDLIGDEDITPDMVVDEDVDTINEIVEANKRRLATLRMAERMMDKCSGPNEIFSVMSKQAAKGKVLEMYMADKSADRQRAQETILDRSMGKVVDRTMSVNVEASNLNDGELDEQIRALSIELGYQTGEGKAVTLLIDEEGHQGSEPTKEPGSESGVAGSFSEEQS